MRKNVSMEKCLIGIKYCYQKLAIKCMNVSSSSYGGEGVVSVGSCVAEENTNFVHRHRLHLLPSRDSNQQLVQLQLMSASAGEEKPKTIQRHPTGDLQKHLYLDSTDNHPLHCQGDFSTDIRANIGIK